MTCYLCGSHSYSFRKGAVRDAPDMKIRECGSCGLVSLESTDHIPPPVLSGFRYAWSRACPDGALAKRDNGR